MRVSRMASASSGSRSSESALASCGPVMGGSNTNGDVVGLEESDFIVTIVFERSGGLRRWGGRFGTFGKLWDAYFLNALAGAVEKFLAAAEKLHAPKVDFRQVFERLTLRF